MRSWSTCFYISRPKISTHAIHRIRPPTLASHPSRITQKRLSSTSSLIGQTLIGHSGRTYTRAKELQSDTSKYQRSIYIAESEGHPFILKRVPEYVYELCQRLNAKFAGSRRLRLHVDENEEERTLVYEFLRGNLFHFMNEYRQAPPVEITQQIMWETGKALEEMYDLKMMHVDFKPDNILLNWQETQLENGAAGPPKLGKVILSDLDSAFDPSSRTASSMYLAPDMRHARFGNIRWRAPELQTGMGIGLFSDVFAYGLIYIYTLISQVPLGMEDYYALAAQVSLSPEELALGRTLEHFGPLTPGFLAHTRDEKWQTTLQNLQGTVEANYDPKNRFETWTPEDFPRMAPEVKELVGRMVRLDPRERLSMREVMQHRSWGSRGSGALDVTG